MPSDSESSQSTAHKALCWDSVVNSLFTSPSESPLDCKEIQPVHPKGDQSLVFIGRTDAEAETLILRPPHAKSWLSGKDPDAGRDWGKEEKGTTEDEMAGWHHRLDGHESGWTLGVCDRQGGLACCNSWGHKELATTERLIWTELNSLAAYFHLTVCWFVWLEASWSTTKNIYIHKINASSTHQFLPLFLNLSVYNYKMEIILSTSQYYSEDNTETRTLEPIHSPVSPVLTTRSDSTAFPFVKLQ